MADVNVKPLMTDGIASRQTHTPKESFLHVKYVSKCVAVVRKCYDCPHFKDGETGTQTLRGLPHVR